MAACRQPGISVAAIARQHDLNDNLVHKWLRESKRGDPAFSPTVMPAPPGAGLASGSPATHSFLPVRVAEDRPAYPRMIHLHFRQGDKELHIDWPAAQSEECLLLIQAWLR
ncbi:transposase [Chitinilyticum litopenaei]|uniref:transposase n=1 Tax=Chitinilyticum litopenaei TaxID=1121276 RepID=UPI003570DDFA